MLDSMQRFFRERILGGAGETSPAADREHALRLAASALIFEIVRADSAVKDEERTVMRTSIQGTFGLSAAEADELMLVAEQKSRDAVSLYEFTSLVDKGLSAEQKKRVVELLWLVCFADAEKHALEEHLVRQIAGLLHVPHPDFIDAKIRARAQSSGSTSASSSRG